MAIDEILLDYGNDFDCPQTGVYGNFSLVQLKACMEVLVV